MRGSALPIGAILGCDTSGASIRVRSSANVSVATADLGHSSATEPPMMLRRDASVAQRGTGAAVSAAALLAQRRTAAIIGKIAVAGRDGVENRAVALRVELLADAIGE